MSRGKAKQSSDVEVSKVSDLELQIGNLSKNMMAMREVVEKFCNAVTVYEGNKSAKESENVSEEKQTEATSLPSNVRIQNLRSGGRGTYLCGKI